MSDRAADHCTNEQRRSEHAARTAHSDREGRENHATHSQRKQRGDGQCAMKSLELDRVARTVHGGEEKQANAQHD